jgi:MFS family permease
MKKLPFSSIIIFIATALIYAIGAATRAGIPGMVFDAIRNELGFSAFQTAGIAGSGVAGCIAFIGISGMLVDRYGWKNLILYGVFFQVFGAWLMHSQSTVAMLWLGAFINGGGRTIGYLALLKLLDTEFDKRYFAALIGFFYIFSYGGTFCGTTPFEALLQRFNWHQLLAFCNIATVALGVITAVVLIIARHNRAVQLTTVLTTPTRKAYPWGELLAQLRRRQCMAAFFCCACGIVIFWTLLGGLGKKFLTDCLGAPSGILGIMNIIVMIEMIFAGTVSFLCGNRRKPFQIFGTAGLFLGTTLLLISACTSGATAALCFKIGFPAIGIGYGMTAVNITACREFVPKNYAASAIGLVNFCANIVMIALMQLAGYLFDAFQGEALTASPIAFRIIFAFYAILCAIALLAALSLPETYGKNLASIHDTSR